MQSKAIGVLLINLGTPEQPTAAAVRRYLREFLMDPRVIAAPRLPWWIILNGFILPRRASKVARLYQKIWQSEGSPLQFYSQQLGGALQKQLTAELALDIKVRVAMTYGKPSIEKALDFFIHQAINKLVILPLFPQYSSTTTGAVFDKVSQVLQRRVLWPALHWIQDYHCHPAYIAALAHSVQQHWQAKGKADKLLISFHGIPCSYHKKGDPYRQRCETTAKLLVEQLKLTPQEWQLAFQSRIGPLPWLEPYSENVLQQWAQAKYSVDVICPGFAVDCLETLEEMMIRNREAYIAQGGKGYHYIPALNLEQQHIELFSDLIKHSIQT